VPQHFEIYRAGQRWKHDRPVHDARLSIVERMMNDELLTLDDLAVLYRCSRRHARDVLVKLVGFPELAPGSTPRNPLWVRAEVQAYLRRKKIKPAQIPHSALVANGL
jgi:hypothetical protein